MPFSTDAIRAICIALIDLDKEDVVADQTRPGIDLMSAVTCVPDRPLERPDSTLNCFMLYIAICRVMRHGADVATGETQVIKVAV